MSVNPLKLDAATHRPRQTQVGDLIAAQLIGDTAQTISAEGFSAAGDGVTDDTVALTNFFAALGTGRAGRGSLAPGKTYLVSAVVRVVNSGFMLEGNGATIKMANGVAVDSISHSVMDFNGVSNFTVSNLICDANRANRTPVSVPAHSVYVRNACSNFKFVNCSSINAVVDGFYVTTDSPTDTSTFPRRGVFDNCHADNSWRNGMSIINGYQIKVIGGSYDNANGSLPMAAIDIEPNVASVTPGIWSVSLIGVSGTGNQGHCFQVASTAMPQDITLIDCVADGTGAGSSVNQSAFTLKADSVSASGLRVRNYSLPTGGGPLVTLGSPLFSIESIIMENCSGPSSAMAISVQATANGTIKSLVANNVTTGNIVTSSAGSLVKIDNVYINGCGQLVAGSDFALIAVQAGWAVRNITALNSTGFFTSSGACLYENFSINNVQAGSTTHSQGVMQPGTGSTVKNGSIVAPTTVTNGMFGLRSLAALASVDNVQISGYLTGNNVALNGSPSLAITASTTLVNSTKQVVFSGTAAAQTLTLPLSSAYTEDFDGGITVINNATQALAIAVQTGDTLVGTASVAAGAVTKICTQGAGGNWYAGSGGSTPAWGGITGTLSAQTDLQTALNALAPLASPTLTGTPSAPTAAGGTNTTQLASTAFVAAAVAAAIAAIGPLYVSTTLNDIVNTVTRTALASFTVPAGTLGTNKKLIIDIAFDYLGNAATTSSFTLEIAYGGVTYYADTTAAQTISAARHPGTLLIKLSGNGATSSQLLAGRVGMGRAGSTTTGLGALDATITAVTGFDTPITGSPAIDSTVDQTFGVFITHSAADPNVSLRALRVSAYLEV